MPNYGIFSQSYVLSFISCFSTFYCLNPYFIFKINKFYYTSDSLYAHDKNIYNGLCNMCMLITFSATEQLNMEEVDQSLLQNVTEVSKQNTHEYTFTYA